MLAADIDPLAVDRHYAALKGAEGYDNILPLVIDFANPSPGIGFDNSERLAFSARCKANMIIALAVIHHLHISAGIPLAMLAAFFASLLEEDGILVLEFVPKEDSQVQKLLALRKDIFADYSLARCIEIFSEHFECLEQAGIEDSVRHILTFRKRSGASLG